MVSPTCISDSLAGLTSETTTLSASSSMPTRGRLENGIALFFFRVTVIIMILPLPPAAAGEPNSRRDLLPRLMA